MARVRLRLGWRAPLMIAPVMIVTAGLLGTGLVAALAQSVGLTGPGAAGHFTLEHYSRVLADREFHAALALTLWVATASTVLATVLGVALALALRRLVAGRRLGYALLQVPLGVPHLAVAAAFLTLLSPSGWLARLAHALGVVTVPADMPAFVYDAWGLGIIFAYTAKEVPFLAVVTTAMLVRLDDGYDAVARTLGASRWQRLRRVTWPLIAPGVGSAALMVFAFVFAAFETPFLLGRPYPSMLAVVAQHRYLSVELAERPAAVALAVVMTTLSGLLVWASLRLSTTRPGETRPMVF
jgi:putative spermidine/putrescine transport system permease protein